MILPHDKLPRWWITPGGDLWAGTATYLSIPYANLPALPAISDDFAWLPPPPRDQSSTLKADAEKVANLPQLVRSASTLGLELPPGFVRFMADATLQATVPTCTDCFLELSESLIPVPGCGPACVVRFLSDSQACVMWYLLLHPQQPACVVASPYFLEPDLYEAMKSDDDAPQHDDLIWHAAICADSFMEFMYRFWIENAIWFAGYQQRPLTAAEAAYHQQVDAIRQRKSAR